MEGIGIALLVVAFVIRLYLYTKAHKVFMVNLNALGKNSYQSTERPTATKPEGPVENDKIVVIEEVALDQVKQAIQQFCNINNQKVFSVLPVITILTANKFVVTFPYDLDSETFCYFVNYLYYPHDIEYAPDIKAWATTRSDDVWIKTETAGKRVMLHIPCEDKERDNVYLTTEDNVGFKMRFSVGYESQPLRTPVVTYSEPTSDVYNSQGRETRTFE